MFRAGKFKAAISAYSKDLENCSETRLRADLLCNRAAAYLKTESYQKARIDAQAALDLFPDNNKARYRLATALIHLRSYAVALDTLRTIHSPDPQIRDLLNQAIQFVHEKRYGQYDFHKIKDEGRRICHADYCSTLIHLRKSPVCNQGLRGVFAKADITIGTLLMASKAIASVFSNEVGVPITVLSEPDSEATLGHLRRQHLCDKIYLMISEHRCGRAVLNLAGGGNESVDIDLRRDDVYDDQIVESQTTRETITEIVSQNVFSLTELDTQEIVGSALFHAPSYFNHSCKPNAVYVIFGDMIFVRAAIPISAGEEIFITYTPLMSAQTSIERQADLRSQGITFECTCELCKFEKENPEIVDPAYDITKNVMTNHSTLETLHTTQGIEEVLAARLKLYQLFAYLPPEITLVTIPTFQCTTPRQYALARLMCLILERLGAGLQDRSPRESAKFYAENFSIAKANLNLSMGTMFAAPETPLQVVRYLSQSPQENDHIKLRWLEQAQIMWSLVSGESASESQRRIMELLLDPV